MRRDAHEGIFMQNTKKVFKYDFKGQLRACVIEHFKTDNYDVVIASVPTTAKQQLLEATETLLPAATKELDIKWFRLVWIERCKDQKFWFVNFQPTGDSSKVYVQYRREVEAIDWLELNCGKKIS